MHKKLAALILIAASTIALTGCAPQNAADYPEQGRWITAQDSDTGKLVGDVWCIDSSHTSSRESFDCQWSSLTDPGTHESAQQASGSYRYVMASDAKEHKIFCIDYQLRKNSQMTSCNWSSLDVR